MSKPLNIYILDDHQIVIDGINLMLADNTDMVVVGEQTDAVAALTEIERLRPDILICDVSMPTMTGIEVSKLLQKSQPLLSILILTMMDDVHVLHELLATGVKGFVLKNKGKEELINAIRTGAGGNNFFSAEVMKQVLAAAKNLNKPEKLTIREIEIIKLIAAGHNSGAIAQTLYISENTVETHRRNMLRKTKTHSSMELINYAREHKVIA